MATLLFGSSDVRRAALQHFFARPGVEDHVRAVARAIERDPTAVARELDRLQQAGILASSRRGRLRIYRLATSALVEELRPLVQKTVGVEARLADALRGVPGIRQALIFGSYARGTERATSDVDLRVIGEPDPEQLWQGVLAAERDLGRDVNVTEYTGREFEKLRRKRGSFVASVLEGPVIQLLGKPHS